MVINTHSTKTNKCFDEWTDLFNKVDTYEEQNAFDLLVFDHFNESNSCSSMNIMEMQSKHIQYAGATLIDCLQYFWFNNRDLIFLHLSRSFRYNTGSCKERILKAIRTNIVYHAHK